MDRYLCSVCICTLKYLHRHDLTFEFVESNFVCKYFDGRPINDCGCRSPSRHGYISVICKNHRKQYEDVFSAYVSKIAARNCYHSFESYSSCPICFDLGLLFGLSDNIHICVSARVLELLPRSTAYCRKHAEAFFNSCRLKRNDGF